MSLRSPALLLRTSAIPTRAPSLIARSLHVRQVPKLPVRRHRHRSSAPARQRVVLQSAFNWTSLAVYLTVGATFGIAVGIYRGYTGGEQHAHDKEDGSLLGQDLQDTMATQMPPGRPGTLSAEEEAKLRMLWQLMLQVTGVAEAAPAHSPNGTSKANSPALSRTTSESSTGDKKKKKRHSLFKKKKDKDDVNEHVPAPEPMTSSTSSSLQSTPDSGK